ncbi:2OG-FeII_Oxy domain-containing protein/DIOX_N domain-containing protein, partial [Cephalotus follicularis]
RPNFIYLSQPHSTHFSLQSNNQRFSLCPPLSMDKEADPPFQQLYKTLFDKTVEQNPTTDNMVVVVEKCELPLIDISRLIHDEVEREECKEEIARASKEWGFFQVINHGISKEILEKMRSEQVKVFKQPFKKKSKQDDENLNFSAGTYRWGSPTATCLKEISWSEAFHISMTDISASDDANSLSLTIQQFAPRVTVLANELADVLAEKLGHKSTFFRENCLPSTCYLRMNRYPPCPIPSEVFGLMPHTDSDFLTILHQDEVGGLQLVKDGKWIAVKPNPEALIVNIGDLFQAWSNNVYKSVNHRVVTNPSAERFSTAYFLCPSHDTVIQSRYQPSVYEKFSFRQYKQKVQEDVQKLGYKVGLPRFLCNGTA